MDALVDHVKSIGSQADEEGRKKIIDSLRDLAISLESPWDSMQRIMYLNFQMTAARIGIDLKLFEMLVASDEPQSVEQLAQRTGASPEFLARFLRYLSSLRMIKESAKDTFTASNVTIALSNKGFQGGVKFYFTFFGPILQETPPYLAENHYQNPSDSTKTPFQKAWNTELPAFLWLEQHPEFASFFGALMTAQHGEMPGWLSVYPIEEETKGWDPEEPVFVDIGGGFGQQCLDLTTKYPDLPGRVILQDLPQAIKNSIPMKNVEKNVHDFCTPQTVKGAKYYYMRNILHDYPDEKCRVILKNIMGSMGPKSVILIDEVVLPSSDVHWHAAQMDFVMMIGLASKERTLDQWHDLLKSVGLKAQKIHTYTVSLRDSIIVAVPE